ncbi:sensor histidine kinase [Fodinisporobacter ferrooxydans]|uniref:histidine kinase n=1 Tax=Fodinisporobacter ferrooxydans TaxID=2901836 RepID=A0ABY4CMH5_9BACL|nr:sensor histidine kinase [Alicyclobacillaceae bacterium MYW30-H2]
MIRDLLLHLLIILLPNFMYQFLNENKRRFYLHKNQIGIGLLYGMSSILCMTFPTDLEKGFILDLRWIPYSIVILYGNKGSWATALALILGYRMYLGGPAAYTAWITAFLLSIVLFSIRKKFRNATLHFRLAMASLLGFFAFFAVMFIFLIFSYTQSSMAFLKSENLQIYFAYALLSIIAMNLSVFMIETIHEKILMENEIQRAEKLHVISELAASIAHEVRNPLTVARGFIQLTSRSLDESNQKYMNIAISELDRAEYIISDYLNLAKPQSEKIEPLHIAEMFENILDILSSFAMIRNVEIYSESEPDLWILGDKVKCKQALINLIKNSIESIEKRGRIDVQAKRKGNQVIIHVIDTGSGMTKEQVARLGYPFYTTKEKGTGLGLMVTFRLIESLGGKLEFESELGKGTTAIISIPLFMPAQEISKFS